MYFRVIFVTKSMTEGKPLKLILQFAVPLLFDNLLQQMYNLVDAAIVGRVLGTGALAAVGATSSVQFLVLGFCIGICIGFGIRTPEQAAEVLKFAGLQGSNDEVLSQVDVLVRGSAKGEAGVQKLRDLLAAATAAGVPAGRVKLDVSIARGLDYYTGTIYETFLDALPTIGSVCSGGRYDNLAGLFTKQQLPGVGASLGLDRLLDAMQALNLIEAVSTPAPVFIAYFVENRLHDYLRLAAQVRAAGLGCEVFPEAKKLGKQLQYADKRGFKLAIIAGEDEFAAGNVQIKDLKSGTSQTVSLSGDDLVAALRKIVA